MPKPTRTDNAAAKAYAQAVLVKKISDPFVKADGSIRGCHICDEPLTVGEILLDLCGHCGAKPSEDPTFEDEDLPF